MAGLVTEEPPSWNNTPREPDAASAEPAGGTGAAMPEAAAMTFEQALAELEKIVQDLERGQLDLEAAIQAYERGTQLKEHCRCKLQEAQLRVERITLGPDGGVRVEPSELA